MFFSKEKSLCEQNQSIVVSRDHGSQKEHRAVNPGRQFDLRHYKLDGDIIQQQRCCDFLLLNDTKKKAYLIELKGKNIDHAVEQLEAGERICRQFLQGYTYLYRIVCGKVQTHKIKGNKFRKFKEKHSRQLEVKENKMEEILN